MIAAVIAVLGGLVALAIATSVRTTRAALIGGAIVALALVVMQVVLAWFLSHPVLPG